MLDLLLPPRFAGEPLHRRRWLQCGMGLTAWAAANAAAMPGAKSAEQAVRQPKGSGFGKARSVIVVFCNGGQSQIDTWDPKPDAPEQIRGEFESIATKISGVRFSEHMPRLAQTADRFTVVRSASHDDLDHGSASYLAFTGRFHPRKSSNPRPSPNDYPALGAVLKRIRPADRFPHTAVHINGPALVPIEPAPGQDGGFLGRAFEPLVLGDVFAEPLAFPTLAPQPELPTARIEARRKLLDSLDDARAGWTQAGKADDLSLLYRQAFELLSRPSSRAAFDLDLEPAALRDRYGRHRSGQACLLARRLVEAGVPWVTVMFNHSGRGQDREPDADDLYGWDTHNDVFPSLKNRLLPRFDQSFSALIEDLDQRGLLDETLVVCLTEFGRAPKVAKEPGFAGDAPGRKHWAGVYSVVFAGAGVSRGAVWGASDRLGARPADLRASPGDLAATLFWSLGIPPDLHYRDTLDRPFLLAEGRPLAGLFTD